VFEHGRWFAVEHFFIFAIFLTLQHFKDKPTWPATGWLLQNCIGIQLHWNYLTLDGSAVALTHKETARGIHSDQFPFCKLSEDLFL